MWVTVLCIVSITTTKSLLQSSHLEFPRITIPVSLPHTPIIQVHPTPPFSPIQIMCGIIGLFTKEELGIHVAGEINTALTMLQHRGQGSLSLLCLVVDACGITTCDGEQVRTVKDNGLVSELLPFPLSHV